MNNGAGKTTLVKCIGGIHRVDAGELLFDGTPQSVHGPRDAALLGVEIVYQDLALCDNLDVVENMLLGREQVTRLGTLDENSMEKRRGASTGAVDTAFLDTAFLDPARVTS